MNEQINTDATIYFGTKGGYNVNSKNLGLLMKNMQLFNEQRIWKWQLKDCLGIDVNGKKLSRYSKAIEVLKTIPEAKELVEQMEKVTEVDESLVVRTRKEISFVNGVPVGSTTPKGDRIAESLDTMELSMDEMLRRAEIGEALEKMGVSSEQIARMLSVM